MAVDVAAVRDLLRRREQLRQQALDERFATAWRDFRKIVEMLIGKYRPRRIYQWGSLLRRKYFSEQSDIDIALEGVGGAERFFALYRDAEELTRFRLDLVELERIEPEYAAAIRQNGVIVYDRDQPDPGPHFRG